MKKLARLLPVLLMLLFMGSATFDARAQRGYNGNYSRNHRDYAESYKGSNSRMYRNDYESRYRVYPNYSYRAPVVIRPRYTAPFVFGPRYYGVPRGSISITFGGNPYYYHGGNFYRPFGTYFQMTLPPVGIRIGILPIGYVPIYLGPEEYYFYNGIYYRRFDDRNYEVVNAPIGAQVVALPRGAKSVIVNGEKFYEFNGTYYKEDADSKGRVIYTVVGKNGEIDNTADTSPPTGDQRDR
jgi:hypothetical protein